MKTLPGRRRSIGLAGSAIWLIAISIVIITWSLLRFIEEDLILA